MLKHDTWELLRPKETSEFVISNDITFWFETHFCRQHYVFFGSVFVKFEEPPERETTETIETIQSPSWNSHRSCNKRLDRWPVVGKWCCIDTGGLVLLRNTLRLGILYTSISIHPHPSGLHSFCRFLPSFLSRLCWNTPRTASALARPARPARLARLARARCSLARLGRMKQHEWTKHKRPILTDNFLCFLKTCFVWLTDLQRNQS